MTVTNTRPAPPEHAGENAFALTTGFAAETLELRRMGIRTDRRITGYLDASAATALTLAGDGLGAATLDGKPAKATRTKRGLTIAVPQGKHTLVVTPR